MIHKGVKTFLSGNINIIDSITLRVIYIKYMLCNYDMSYSFGNNLISEVRVLCIALLNNCLYIFWSNFFVCAFNTFFGVWKEQKYVSLLLQQFCFLSYLSIIILISIFPWFYMYTMKFFSESHLNFISLIHVIIFVDLTEKIVSNIFISKGLPKQFNCKCILEKFTGRIFTPPPPLSIFRYVVVLGWGKH